MAYSLINRALCASVLTLAPLTASAAVVTTSDTFTAFQTQDISIDATYVNTYGPSWLDITTTSSGSVGSGTGNVTVSTQTTVSATYENTLSLDQAKMARITMKEAIMLSGHQSTYYEGSSIEVSLNVGSLSLSGSVSSGGTMRTATLPNLRRTTPLQEVVARSNPTQMALIRRSITGASLTFGINSETETRHALTGLTGFLWAEHEATGTLRQTFVTNPFADLTRNFDLGLEGTWNIGFSNAQVTAKSEAYILRGFGGAAEYKIGFGCGDPGDDSDNGTFCVDDGQWISPLGNSGTPIFLRGNTHRLSSDRNLNLGSITVTANPGPTPVPVPASGALMLTLMGAGALARRRR